MAIRSKDFGVGEQLVGPGGIATSPEPSTARIRGPLDPAPCPCRVAVRSGEGCGAALRPAYRDHVLPPSRSGPPGLDPVEAVLGGEPRPDVLGVEAFTVEHLGGVLVGREPGHPPSRHLARVGSVSPPGVGGGGWSRC